MRKRMLARVSLASLFLASASFAATYTPISITTSSFDFDMTVENNAVPGTNPDVYTGVSTSLDASGNVFYQAGLSGSTLSTGLPENRQISAVVDSDTLNFTLADYGDGSGLTSNVLQVAPVDSTTTLTFAAASYFESLAFLGFSTEAGETDVVGDITVNFTTGLSTTFVNALAFPDWYYGVTTLEYTEVFNAEGRVNNVNGLYNQDLSVPLTATSGGRLFANTITLSETDQARQVSSVTFTITTSDPGDYSYVAAVSGTPSSVPEPGMLSLLLLGPAVWGLRRLVARKAA